VVLTLRTPVGQYAARYVALLPLKERSSRSRPRRVYLVEDAQRQVEGDPEIGLVDDLADPEIAGQAAQDVRVLAAQLVVRLELAAVTASADALQIFLAVRIPCPQALDGPC